jgi:hypothetical protein
VSGWSSPSTACWGGHPIAHHVGQLHARGRAVLRGEVGELAVRTGRGRSFDALFSDGTGTVLLRFLGRSAVPGLVPGTHLVVEGTALAQDGRFVLLNPLYRFVTCDG